MTSKNPQISVCTLSNSCIECIYEYHKNTNNILYSSIRDVFAIDKFTNNPFIGKILGKNLRLSYYSHRVLRDYYDLINTLYDECHFMSGCSSYIAYTCIIGNFEKNKKILQPLPFSTTIDMNNAYNSLDKDSPDFYVYMIHIPINTRFLCIENDAKKRNVILPSGILEITGKSMVNNRKIFHANFIGTNTYDDMFGLWKEYGYQETS